jgi:hypothetical protein
MAAWRRGTTSVHKIFPAFLVMIILLVGKAKTPVRVGSRRLGLSFIEVRSRLGGAGTNRELKVSVNNT